MSHITTLLLLILVNAGLSYGMKCPFSQNEYLSKFIDSCPRIYEPSDKTYCCVNNGGRYCCDFMEYAFELSWIAPVVVIAVAIFLVLTFCVSCFCCTCCPWNRKRHGGTVYRKVQAPSTTIVIPTPAIVPPATPHYTSPTYPINSTGISQPPAYSEVVYEKQAPYNPNYVSTIQQ